MSQESLIEIEEIDDDPFARVSKKMLADERLTFRAKGILSYLLGKPRDWKVRIKDVVNQGPEGIDAIRAGLMELRRTGYAMLRKEKNEDGTIKAWVWKVSSKPKYPPELDRPQLVKPTHTKKEPTKNESLKSPDVDGSTPMFSVEKLTKQEQLDRIKRSNRRLPTEDFFNAMCEKNEWVFFEYRPNLYDDLVRDHFHHWDSKKKIWRPIGHLEKFLQGLNDTILRQK